MDVYEAIEKRRTVRVFTRAASEEQIKKVVLAGSRAASAGNRQPWEFIIIDDPKIIDQIAEHKYQQNRSISSSAPQAERDARALRQKQSYRNCSVVAVCHEADEEAAESAWMCVQNMYLAATAEGLGIVPSTFWDEHQQAVEKLLGIPEEYKLTTVALIGVQEGYPDHYQQARAQRRPDFSWLHRNKF
ncbi:MAG: nitroreductase family protein [Chloroflexota bacterium]